MHPGIKLRHIRAFLDIAAAASLSQAAERQGVTQPALSRSLAELEALLGQPLFARQGRRLVPTDAGRLFRIHAEAGLKALEAGAAAIGPTATGGRIRVGCLPTVAGGLFPRVALRYRTARPDILLCIETGPHAHLLQRLRDGSIDLVLGRLPTAAEMSGLAFEHLYEEEIILVARIDHPLAGRPAAEVVTRAPLVLPPEGAIIRRPVEDYLASLGLTAPRAAFETVSPAIGRGLILGSDAVWFISRGVVAETLAAGELAVFPTGAGFLSGAVGITRMQGAAPVTGLDALVDITKRLAAERR